MVGEVTVRLYNLIVTLVVWCVLLPLHAMLALSGRIPFHAVEMRLGKVQPQEKQRRHRILIHAVSVGETHAAEPLIDYLSCEAGDIGFVLSTGNRHGLQAAGHLQKRRPEIEECVYAPWDTRAAVTRWLKTLKPSVVVVVETELWPNLFAVCKESGIPLVLVNGRIYENDVGRYILARSLFSRVLAGVDLIGMQSEAERKRFLAIGAPPRLVEVAGNLKHTVPQIAAGSETVPWNHLPAGTQVVIGGSTHHPEEQWLIEVFGELKRHIPQTTEEVFAMVQERLQRRESPG
jgi:3-deoxy-D-manno-octulosonic-acid transferase